MSVSLQNSHLGRLRNYLGGPVIALNIWGIPLLRSPSQQVQDAQKKTRYHSFTAVLHEPEIALFSPG